MNSKPKYTKTQIRFLGEELCTEELRSLNLDISGGLGQKRARLREALHPNETSSQISSQLPSTQPTQIEPTVLPSDLSQK